MNTADTILERFGLRPPSAAPGRYYTTCPKCSAVRTRAHQKAECLGITIDDQGVQFGCNHCDFKGGAFYNNRKPNGAARDTFVATYDYYDENGKLLFQVCRTADKQFPQRRPDGNGGWSWGTKGVRKVLFHLNEATEAIANGHTILIVEGEKDVLNLERIGLPATCNPGGASEPGKKSKWRKEYSETLRGADIVILPDHDQAGYAHGDAIAGMSTGLAKSVRVLKLAEHWRDCPKGGDVSDWIAVGHTREQLDALIEHAEPWMDQETTTLGEQKADGHHDEESRIHLVAFDDIKLGTERSDLVKGLIPRVGLTIVWGPPKSGKSFWTFDVTMHIALGWQYRGRKIVQGPIVYCAMEGASGFRKRIEAFKLRYPTRDQRVPFYLVDAPLDLVKDHRELIDAIKRQLDDEIPVAIVLDTLNRSLRGSESNDEDMANYIKAAHALRQAFDCAIIVVHHCGVDGTRPRGHTSLTGAADAQISVSRDTADNIIVTVEWMKDGAEGEVVASQLEVITVGTDDDGDAITSCVIVAAESDGQVSTSKPGGAAGIALEALYEAIGELGEVPPASRHIPANTRTIPVVRWREYCEAKMITTTDKPDTRRKAFVRACERLQRLKIIGVWKDNVWVAGHAGQART